MLKKAIDSMLYLLKVDERKIENGNLNSNGWSSATSCPYKKEISSTESYNLETPDFNPSFLMATSFHSAPLPQQSFDHVYPMAGEHRSFVNNPHLSNHPKFGLSEDSKYSTSHGKLGLIRSKSSRKRNLYKHERLMDQRENGVLPLCKPNRLKEENSYCDMVEWGTDVTYLTLSEKFSGVDKLDTTNVPNYENNNSITRRQNQTPISIPPPPFTRVRRRSRPLSIINSKPEDHLNVDLIDLNGNGKDLGHNDIFLIPASISTDPLNDNPVHLTPVMSTINQTRSASSTPTLVRGNNSTFTMAHLKSSLESITHKLENESLPKGDNEDTTAPNPQQPNLATLNPSDLPNSISNLKVTRVKVTKSKANSKTSGQACKVQRTVHNTNKGLPLSPECRHWSFTFYDFDEKKPTQDSQALVHSVFAVVSASLRQHRGNHKQTGKKRNRLTGYQCRQEESDFIPASHQHLVLENLPNINSGTKDKLWHLCIKWNPSDSKEDPSTIGGSVTKTRIIATLGAQNDNYLDQINLMSNDSVDCFTKRPRLNRNTDVKNTNCCDLNAVVCCQCNTSVKLAPCCQVRPNSCADMLKCSWMQSSLNGMNHNDLNTVSDSELEGKGNMNTDGQTQNMIHSDHHLWFKSKWNYPSNSNRIYPMDRFSNYCDNCPICKQTNHIYYPNHWHLPNNKTRNHSNYCHNDRNINTLHPVITPNFHPRQKCCLSSVEHCNIPCTKLYPNLHYNISNANDLGGHPFLDFDHKTRRSQSIQHTRKRAKYPNNYQPKSRSKSQPQTERDIRKFIPNRLSYCHHIQDYQAQQNVLELHDQISNIMHINCPTTPVGPSKSRITSFPRRKSEFEWTYCMDHEYLSSKIRSHSKTHAEAQDRRDRHQDRKNLGQQQVKEWLENSAQKNHFPAPKVLNV